MRTHLRFLFKNREALRLKVNAAEDLLLNGKRDPTHRGTCVHLLSKVDLSCLSSALTRVQDAKERTALLAGVVRFSSDVGLLLLYVESLKEAGAEAEGAAAFSAAVRRINFADISDARMRRVLELIATTFEGHERVQVLFGLLQSATFHTAFDRTAGALPDSLAGIFIPLRAVHDVIVEGRENRQGLEALTAGMKMLLEAPQEVLRSHPLPIRQRLLESAVKLVADPGVADRAEDVLLDSLPRDSRTFSRLGMLRAGSLLKRHEDERAAQLLRLIKDAHASFLMPARWLAALEAPLIGRMAWIGWSEGTGRKGAEPRLRRAFWLDVQRIVWLRIGRPDEAARLAEEARLHRSVAMGGLAPVAAEGVTADGVPWVAVPPIGRPADEAFAGWRPSRPQAMALALGGALALHGVALAGVLLPDAEVGRFLVEPGPFPLVMLADLGGAIRAEPSEAATAHRELVRDWLRAAFSPLRDEDISLEFRARLKGAPDLPTLVELLAPEL